ncbi:acetyl-CoA carboxylase biotin carboxyl carrier protein [Macrococcoides caseolyticum]|uniref:acetyl-CoA carboxylase biotin carboxyl carrier protein n=1 Tax=Macrococcoides caseolyticum TaxID=69966 RepID=UPI000C32B0A7|nr:acetyl-CoA carboxylase biotin carboxyl carrier protein [Macrococcus caseolyticus]PKE10185.1 acetyl-CoA carboxylase biotin carboxyl carrier protein [Macrococcus caseolyticus]PKE47620.1 acetyl-CoA carboxylase biotin carboxyl carrier protein [Macrococcus caseolyticus]PKF14580.1 acetyl-CoA carboxylase biotin carboxyl carrier protein [Macrococcus caseolyticus]PNZ71233.1 acetyl-CoA carboxylase biotin carboxyl carrier protein [Macrococcus caseolyticus]QPT47061.1 acetyl-CoA carboxylase biotin carbo
MNLEHIKVLIDMVDRSEITEFNYEDKEMKVVLKKEKEIRESVTMPVKHLTQEQIQVKEPASTDEFIEDAITINAPMVGTFYKSPSPEADPYVKVGDKVKNDSIVCILEAMKLFNEIQAEVSGEIIEILAEDGQLVEYGQPLFKVK